MTAPLVWITGASSGLGAALRETMPFDGARVINISRSPADGVENLVVDLASPESWRMVRQHLADELASWSGPALFVNNAASMSDGAGFAGEVDPAALERHLMINGFAAIMLGDAFVAACRPGLDAGLVMVSSTASTSLPLGRAAYGASKAAVEQWARVVAEERRHRGHGPWVLAVLPGSVDTPGLRRAVDADERDFPRAPALRAAYEAGTVLDPLDVARSIWATIPPPEGSPTIVRVGASIQMDRHEFDR